MMLKRVVVVSGVLVCSSWASAEEAGVAWKIKGKLRGDAYQSSTTSNKDPNHSYIVDDSTTTKTSELVLKRAQIEMIGSKGPVSLRIKYYAESNFLKNALVEYKPSENCSLTFGKMDVRDYSWEMDYSTTDNYIFSTTGKTGSSVNIEPTEGVEAKGVMGDHSLFLQVLQGPTIKNTVSTEKSTGGLTTSLQYRGQFADKMVQPIATYLVEKAARSKGDTVDSSGKKGTYNYGNGYQSHMGVGLRFVVAGSTTELEYDAAKILKQKDSDTSKDENVTSIVFQSRMPVVADFTPYVKVLVDSDKKGADENLNDFSRTAFAVGTEYAWYSNVRVHGLFIMDKKTTKSVDSKGVAADQKDSTNAFNFGVTASI